MNSHQKGKENNREPPSNYRNMDCHPVRDEEKKKISLKIVARLNIYDIF